jgi:hypothetical protein
MAEQAQKLDEAEFVPKINVTLCFVLHRKELSKPQ